MNLHDGSTKLCDALDIETQVDEALVLDRAKVAADNVIRKAAPITTHPHACGHSDADVEEIERLAAKALAEGRRQHRRRRGRGSRRQRGGPPGVASAPSWVPR